MVLYEGRGELLTVTGADTVAAHPACAATAPALGAAARACDAVLRLLDSSEPNPAAYNLLCRYLDLLDGDGGGGRQEAALDGAAGLATALAFRLKLALAAGFAPELGSARAAARGTGSAGSPARPAGSSARACQRGGFDALRGRACVHGDGTRQAAGDAPVAPGAPCARPSARSPRRSSTTLTFSFARRHSAGGSGRPGRSAKMRAMDAEPKHRLGPARGDGRHPRRRRVGAARAGLRHRLHDQRPGPRGVALGRRSRSPRC